LGLAQPHTHCSDTAMQCMRKGGQSKMQTNENQFVIRSIVQIAFVAPALLIISLLFITYRSCYGEHNHFIFLPFFSLWLEFPLSISLDSKKIIGNLSVCVCVCFVCVCVCVCVWCMFCLCVCVCVLCVVWCVCVCFVCVRVVCVFCVCVCVVCVLCGCGVCVCVVGVVCVCVCLCLCD
jgi:hypothetical protein